MIIREATESDVGEIRALNEAAVPHVTTLSVGGCAQLLEAASIALVVRAEDSDSLVGFCLVLGPGLEYASVNYRWVMDRYDDALYLDRVVIAAEQQGRGVGRRLYSEVERRMASGWSQFPWLALEVNLDPPNPGSLAFHERLGFEALDICKCQILLCGIELPPVWAFQRVGLERNPQRVRLEQQREAGHGPLLPRG